MGNLYSTGKRNSYESEENLHEQEDFHSKTTNCPDPSTKSSPRQISALSLGSLRLPSKIFTRRQRKRGNTYLKSSQTNWPSPVSETLFISHFKRTSRNQEFQIDSIIAEGAFGSVFKISDKKNPEQLYALKVIKKSKIIEQNCVQQIKTEVDIQKQCGHQKFLVKQFDTWQNKQNLHILSDFIPNGELLILNFFNIQLPLELIKLYIAEISLAIEFLHNAGVIYRDLKPENIILTLDYHLKLTDFGLSKWLKFGETTKTMCGTAQYMAPEILRGEEYNHSVDWWSLGIIACLFFTKEYPNTKYYLQSEESQLIEKIESEHLTPSEETHVNPEKWQLSFFPDSYETITSEGKDLLRRLLEVNPRFRLKSVMALQRISMYMKFKIDERYVLQHFPLQIMKDNGLDISALNTENENFENF